MQRIGDQYPVVDNRGNGVAGATVTVYTASVSSPLPTAYVATGSALTPAAQANPMTTDALGRWSCALPDGRYDFTFSGSNFPTYTIPNIVVTDTSVTLPSPALGTVTSVGLSGPAIFTYSSAVTGSGTLTMTLATQTANTLWAGPTTGAAATPTFRAMVLADLPSHGPAAATYGSATNVAQVVVNAQGIITSVANVAITPAWSVITGKNTTLLAYALTDQVLCLFSQTASVTVGNTTTETSIVSTGAGTATIPANQLIAGSTVVVEAEGYGAGVAADTLTVRYKIGANTVLDQADAITTWTASRMFKMRAAYTVRTTGAGGTGIGQLYFQYQSAQAVQDLDDITTATSTIDTTASNAVDVTVQWGTAVAGDTLTCTNLRIYLHR